MPLKILCVEDDPHVAEQIKHSLNNHGYMTDVSADGKSALHQAINNDYAVITLDRLLPDIDGIELLKAFREHGVTAPAIMISSLGNVEERIWGLRSGCDDYMTKPFSSEEMIARVEVLLKRLTSREEINNSIKVSNLKLNLLTRKVSTESKEVDLKQIQFKLLKFLMENSGILLTREIIFESVWGYDFDPGTKLIDVHLSSLRKVIDEISGQVKITAERGAGFVLQPI